MPSAALVLFGLALVASPGDIGAGERRASTNISPEIASGHFDVVPSAFDVPPRIQELLAAGTGTLVPGDAPIAPAPDGARTGLRFVWGVKKPPLYIIHVEVIGSAHRFWTVAVRETGRVTVVLGDLSPYPTFEAFREHYLASHPHDHAT